MHLIHKEADRGAVCYACEQRLAHIYGIRITCTACGGPAEPENMNVTKESIDDIMAALDTVGCGEYAPKAPKRYRWGKKPIDECTRDELLECIVFMCEADQDRLERERQEIVDELNDIIRNADRMLESANLTAAEQKTIFEGERRRKPKAWHRMFRKERRATQSTEKA